MHFRRTRGFQERHHSLHSAACWPRPSHSNFFNKARQRAFHWNSHSSSSGMLSRVRTPLNTSSTSLFMPLTTLTSRSRSSSSSLKRPSDTAHNSLWLGSEARTNNAFANLRRRNNRTWALWRRYCRNKKNKVSRRFHVKLSRSQGRASYLFLDLHPCHHLSTGTGVERTSACNGCHCGSFGGLQPWWDDETNAALATTVSKWNSWLPSPRSPLEQHSSNFAEMEPEAQSRHGAERGASGYCEGRERDLGP